MGTETENLDPVKAEKALAERTNPAFTSALAVLPKSLKEIIEIGNVAFQGGLVPAGVKNAAAASAIIMRGLELGVPPGAALNGIMIVNGRTSVWGDMALGLVQGSGKLEAFEEDGPDTALQQGYGRCKLKLRNFGEVERTFSIEEAKKAGLWSKQGPWSNYPGRMLQMRARAFAMRDGAAAVLVGIAIMEDIIDVEGVWEDRGPVNMPKRAANARRDAIPAETVESVSEGANAPQIANAEAERPSGAGQPDVNSPDAVISMDRRKALFELRETQNVTLPQLREFLFQEFKLRATTDLTNAQADKVEAWLKGPHEPAAA